MREGRQVIYGSLVVRQINEIDDLCVDYPALPLRRLLHLALGLLIWTAQLADHHALSFSVVPHFPLFSLILKFAQALYERRQPVKARRMPRCRCPCVERRAVERDASDRSRSWTGGAGGANELSREQTGFGESLMRKEGVDRRRERGG
jgi:hypothetical protein